MEKKIPQSGGSVYYWQTGSLFFGLLLLVIGGFYFARGMGWIRQDFPFWPSIVIFFGLLFVITSFRKVTRY